ncbi:hypothetical protein BFG60_4731 [Microcystis aeruginosa NIES-98]|nr:hypothetical protein BFG60_4731 [Microcystis aeruginosa NIES-98]
MRGCWGIWHFQLSVILALRRQETGDRRQYSGECFYLFSPLPNS